ncbi:hypothetical protein L9G15_23735, partial [Shewanella sp. A3A]|nr:hypothetical protein [Shewanella ferrihydritica]
MKKLPIFLLSGVTLVTGFLALRVVHLEQRLAEAESRQVPVSRQLPARKLATAISPLPPLEAIPPQMLAAELASARAELGE